MRSRAQPVLGRKAAMPSWIRTVAVRALAAIPALLTLVLLAGVAVWGALNDWTLPSFAHLLGKPDVAAG
jgi:hypothetical protein